MEQGEDQPNVTRLCGCYSWIEAKQDRGKKLLHLVSSKLRCLLYKIRLCYCYCEYDNRSRHWRDPCFFQLVQISVVHLHSSKTTALLLESYQWCLVNGGKPPEERNATQYFLHSLWSARNNRAYPPSLLVDHSNFNIVNFILVLGRSK